MPTNIVIAIDDPSNIDAWGLRPKSPVAWAAGNYAKGTCVTHSGQLWLAQAQTSGVPGVSADWESILPSFTGAAGALYPQGGWNASTNSPALADGVGTEGYCYRVSTEGATTIDGVTDWNVDDLVAFISGAWRKIRGKQVDAADITDSQSVGRAVLTAANAAAARSALGLAAVAASGSFADLVDEPPGGMRNRIINGGMHIDQRDAGAAKTFTAAAALAYCVDRFYGYCTGANVTGQRVAGSAPDKYLYQFTGAASVTAIGFGQRIEAENCFDLAGQTATLSVKLANSLLTTVTWTAYYANSADTFGSLASPTRTQIATGNFTVNSTLATYQAQISIPGAATTGIEIVFTVGAQTSGTWKIGAVQLELGSLATLFEQLPFSSIFDACERYFEKSYLLGTAPGAAVGAGTNGVIWTLSTNISMFKSLCKRMRAVPTIVVYDSAGASNKVSYLNGSWLNNGTPVISTIGERGFVVSTSTASSTAIGFDYTAEAEL